LQKIPWLLLLFCLTFALGATRFLKKALFLPKITEVTENRRKKFKINSGLSVFSAGFGGEVFAVASVKITQCSFCTLKSQLCQHGKMTGIVEANIEAHDADGNFR
jgi:hypothetical protein